MNDLDSLTLEALRTRVRTLETELADAKAAARSGRNRPRLFMYMYGGLGNQLFQAAFAIVLREALDADLALIAASYKDDDLRSFMLVAFPALRFTLVPIDDAVGAMAIHERDCRHIPLSDLIPQLAVILEQSGRLFFSGFWQNESLFSGRQALIRSTLQPEVSEAVRAEVDRVRREESIGVHVRRHGYGHMGLVKASYYLEAIEQIRREKGDVPVKVFTDDPSFCHYMFRAIPNLIVEKKADIGNPMRDFCILSACRHHVIANSSFSWWAAWLNESETSIIYAPRPWIVTDSLTDPVPDRWRRIADAIQAP